MTELPKGIEEVPTEFNIPPYKPLTKEKVLQDMLTYSLKEELIGLLNQVKQAIEELRCLISECRGSHVEKMSEKLLTLIRSYGKLTKLSQKAEA